MDQNDMTFETLTSIKPYGGRDSNVMFDPRDQPMFDRLQFNDVKLIYFKRLAQLSASAQPCPVSHPPASTIATTDSSIPLD